MRLSEICIAREKLLLLIEHENLQMMLIETGQPKQNCCYLKKNDLDVLTEPSDMMFFTMVMPLPGSASLIPRTS